MELGDTLRHSRLTIAHNRGVAYKGSLLGTAHTPDVARKGLPPVAKLLVCVLVVVTAETLIYPSQNYVPSGLFSFSVGTSNLRLLDLLLVAVSAAALLARRTPGAVRGSFYLWLGASVAYVAAMAYLGSSHGASTGVIFTESRFLIYVILLVPLAGVVSGEDLLRTGATALKILSIPLALSAILSFAHATPIYVPGFPGSTFGAHGGDIGTIVGVLALCYVGQRALKGKASWAALWILYPLTSNQRASILCTTVVAFIAILALWVKCGVFGPRGQRKVPAGVVISVALVIAVLALIYLATGEEAMFTPIVDAVSTTFGSEGKLASAETRTDGLSFAMDLIQQQPVSGYGLGQGVQFFDVYGGQFVATDSAHNFVVDVMLRGGILGALFAFGFFASAFAGPRPWTLARSAWAWILVTVAAKGLLEPAFDKYRLAFFIALALTAVVITRAPAAPAAPKPARRPRAAAWRY